MLNIKKTGNIKSVFIFSLWILGLVAILIFYENMQNQIENYLLTWVGKITLESSKNIDTDINNRFNVLDRFIHNLSKEELADPQKLAESFDEVVRANQLKRMAIATLDGTAYFDNGEVANLADRRYFKESIQGKRWVSQVLYSKIDGKRSNVFSIPLYVEDDIVGILLFSVFTDDLYRGFNLDMMKQIGETIIINTEGNIIAAEGMSVFSSGDFNLFENLKKEGVKVQSEYFKYNSKGYVKLNFSNNNKYILCYSKLNYQGLWVMNLIDYTAIKASYQFIIQGVIGIITLIAFLVGMIFILFFNKEKKNLKKLENMAYTEPITGGHNDKYLRNNLYQIVDIKDKYAFMSLEIRNIKKMVSVFGLKSTEFILKEIYTYLNSLLDEEELVVHSYLGEYKLLLKYSSIKQLNERLKQIDFTKIHENIHFIIGVYLINDLEISYDDLCVYVSVAKEFIKNEVNRELPYIIYNQYIHKKEIDKFKLEEDIKNGIENKEFKAWFQPKYAKDGQTIVGAEALVRWHKYGSVIAPYIFIPTCEANGLIKKIDELVFEDVCKNLRSWIEEGKNVVPIGINLSRSYLDKIDFIIQLEAYMERYQIPRELISFEITESWLMGNEERLKDIVTVLHEKGFKVSVDDFGVGYSSLKAISSAHFDTLKIDKSFIDGIGNPKWESIIKYTIDLANQLDMTVIVEGVETKEQYQFLLQCNCHMFQGYYFNRPMIADHFKEII